MKKFLILTLLLASCSASAVQENANFVSVQILPMSNIESEKIKNSKTDFPTLSNKSFPTPENSKYTWEDSYSKEIIERERASNLKRLKSKVLAEEDFEVRIWSGFGITLLQGFVLKRTSGEWSAVDLDWEVFENRKGKRNARPLDKKLDEPKSGWEATWQKLVDAGILTLPSVKSGDIVG